MHADGEIEEQDQRMERQKLKITKVYKTANGKSDKPAALTQRRKSTFPTRGFTEL